MTSCTNWVIRKIDPKVPKYMKNDTPLVTANARLANRSSGSIGCAVRRAGRDQRAGRGCERGGGRGRGEERERTDERPLASEAIADRGAGDERDGERERVRVDRPLELLKGRAEILADRRQGDRDDEVVEDHHEQRERSDREGPAGARRLGRHWVDGLLEAL